MGVVPVPNRDHANHHVPWLCDRRWRVRSGAPSTRPPSPPDGRRITLRAPPGAINSLTKRRDLVLVANGGGLLLSNTC